VDFQMRDGSHAARDGKDINEINDAIDETGLTIKK
jgi:hypothetical protein